MHLIASAIHTCLITEATGYVIEARKALTDAILAKADYEQLQRLQEELSQSEDYLLAVKKGRDKVDEALAETIATNSDFAVAVHQNAQSKFDTFYDSPDA